MQPTKQRRAGAAIIEGLEAKPDFVEKMINVIMDGLDAKVRVFEKGDSTGRMVPDQRARLEAFKLAMAYMEGLPLQRILQASYTHSPTQSMDDLQDAMAASPSFLRAIELSIEKAKKSRDGSRTKVAVPLKEG